MRHQHLAHIALLSLGLSLAACGGGGGGNNGGDSDPMVDDQARRAVLSDLGNHIILPTLRDLDTAMAQLATRVSDLAGAPADSAARAAAQQAWRAAMIPAQRAEVLQIGPGARSSEPGGMDLRDQIYAYPLLNQCRIHRAAYASEGVDANSPIDGTGLGALEYLLFEDVDNSSCPPDQGVDASALRAAHASRVADRAAAVAAQLRDEWEPSGDNFLAEFANAGNGGMTYDSPQDALDAVSVAIFYAEKEGKDRKLADPTGIGGTGIPPCTTVSCPERVESRFAGGSGDHIENNLRALRDVFSGGASGMGLNDLLRGVGREDLATRIIAEIDAALATEAQISDFEAEITGITDRTACVNASANRTGEPAVCRFHGLVDRSTDTLRAEVTSVLNLRIPLNAAGDND